MAIEWDDVRIFQAAIRAGDFSSAARRLGINRTTIGRRFARLERAAFADLWEQMAGGYRPTPRGRAVLRAAAAMERAMERLTAELESDEAFGGPVRLAGTAGIAGLLLPEFAHFREAHPGVAVEITGARDAIAALHQRHADIGIAIATAKPRDLAGLHVGRITQRLYAAKGADASRRIGWGHAMRLANPQPWARVNAVEGPSLACEVDSLPAMIEAVRAGVGAAWLWSFCADEDPTLVRLDAPPPRGSAADLWLLHRDVAVPDRPMLALRDALAEALSARINPRR
ncbi:MAG TPA: LysR family transcriptional regulator [Sphingomonas sp.]|nr:LysR family transcriptional regulator [Sphingomonas sp.]